MQSKKIVKLAIIREQGETPCPFGLDIPDGCKTAGKCVVTMQSIDDPKITGDEREEIKESNKRILMVNSGKAKCKYANYLFTNDKVECGFGDHGDGAGAIGFKGTPSMTGYTGLMSVPSYDREVDWSSTFGLGGFNTFYNSIASADEDEIQKKALDEDEDE